MLPALALLLYLGAAARLLVASRSGEDPPPGVALALRAGVVLHLLGLGWTAWTGVTAPGFAESLSGLALGVTAAAAWGVRGRLVPLSVFLAPAGAALLLLSLLVPAGWQVTALRSAGTSWWLPLHVGLMLAALTSFFVEFVVGLLQSIVRGRLKRKQLAGLARFPSLETLDRMQVRATLAGLTTLGLGIGIGGVWAGQVMHHQTWLLDPKVAFAVIMWIWYAISLGWRLHAGWHGRASMVLSSVGFALLSFSVLGFDFVVAGFHAYGR